MEEINIDYTIPTSKDEINLETWMKFENLQSQEGMDEEFLQKKMLEIFCGIPTEYAHKLKATEIQEIELHLNNVLGTKSLLTLRFEFEGVRYGFIPNFEDDLTYEEKILLDQYLENKEYERLLSIIYRPIKSETGNLYQIEPFIETHTKFLRLRYDIFEGVLAFFFQSLREFNDRFPTIYPKRIQENDEEEFDFSKRAQFISKWGGYTEITWLLANGDITKVQQIYKMNCIEVLYWASFVIEKNNAEAPRPQ